MLLNFKGEQYKLAERLIKYQEPSEFIGYLFAADTESCLVDGRWEPQMLTYWDEKGGIFRWLESGVCPLGALLEILEERWGHLFSDSEKPRDWPVFYGYFHNLEYDWGQLIKHHQVLYHLSKYLKVVKRTYVEIGGFDVVFVRGMFKGKVTYIDMEVSKQGRCFKLSLRDTFAFFSTSLAKLAKQFGFPEKEERPEDIGKVDYRAMPDCPEKEQFVHYALRDAEITYLAASKILQMHERYQIGIPKVSASSFACTVMTRKLDKQKPLINNLGGGLVQLAINAYYGGRFGGLVVGKLDNINIYDINSSYPTALACLPSFTRDTGYFIKENMDVKQAVDYCRRFPCTFLFLSGEELNDRYPAIMTRLPNGDLVPVYGRFENLYTTGPEFLAGYSLGYLQKVKVHKLVGYYDNNPFFRDLIQELYEIKKNSEPGSIDYLTAKLVMNSIYGKFIETHNPLRLLWLDDLIVLAEESKLAEWGTKYYDLYIEGVRQGQDPFSFITDWMRQNINEEKRAKMVAKTLSSLPLSIHDFGYYAIPPLAAAVTGIARARLYLAMVYSEAVYWDTDSIFTEMNPQQLEMSLAYIPDTCYPAGVPRLSLGPDLGQLNLERELATVYLAGIKRYWVDDKKQAHHAMSMIPKEKIQEAIQQLIERGEYEYEPGERPLTLVEASSLEDLGKFTRLGAFRLERNFDYRMSWTKEGEIWVGLVKPYEEILREVSK